MASNAGAVAAETPPTTRIAAAPPATVAVDDAVRLLKRPREPESSPPHERHPSSPQLDSLPSPTKSARLALAAQAPIPLTGAAALEDERRQREEEKNWSHPATSENPSQTVLASLISATSQAMSRPSDAPQAAPPATMEAAAKTSTAANNRDRAGDGDEASSQQETSMADAPVTESPAPMDVDGKGEAGAGQQVAGLEERHQPGSLSYPGSLQSSAAMAVTPSRGVSYPMPNQGQSSPPSSNSKKHKCPYCSTEFTRHHNLKSHLLTHSQEKPYVCTECQMRFRRLHDLKRHGKLHTGEKSHVCPKCNRKFARGDALARHSKGAGGCAGRRSSMGSFAYDGELDGMGEGDESAMSGIAYDAGDEDLRRQSLPTVNSQQMAGGESLVHQSRTYPPAGPRPSGLLYPPRVGQLHATTTASTSAANSMGSSHTPNTSVSSVPVGGGGGASGAGMYSQTGVTESPKPLSPGVQGTDAPGPVRQRSPSLSQHFTQQMGRRQPEVQSPHGNQARPKLPGLSHPSYPPHGLSGFGPGRAGAGGSQSGSESGNMFAQSDPSVWAYISTLEEKIKSMSEKVASLDAELAAVKKQVENRDVVASTTA